MLKAVCLDEQEHKYLIDFIHSYKDENNRFNNSSAIKFLMIKGYQALYGDKKVTIPNYNKSKVDVEEIKKDVITSLTLQIKDQLTNQIKDILKQELNEKANLQLIENNSQLMNTLTNVISNFNRPQPVYIQQQQPSINSVENNSLKQENRSIVKDNSQEIYKHQSKELIKNEINNLPLQNKSIKGNTKGLLANLLSNINR